MVPVPLDREPEQWERVLQGSESGEASRETRLRQVEQPEAEQPAALAPMGPGPERRHRVPQALTELEGQQVPWPAVPEARGGPERVPWPVGPAGGEVPAEAQAEEPPAVELALRAPLGPSFE